MGSHGNIREGKQSLDQGRLHDLLRHILVYIVCFLFVYVKTYSKEFMLTDSCDQILCFDQTASGCIYKDYSILHLAAGSEG